MWSFPPRPIQIFLYSQLNAAPAIILKLGTYNGPISIELAKLLQGRIEKRAKRKSQLEEIDCDDEYMRIDVIGGDVAFIVSGVHLGIGIEFAVVA